MRILVLLLSLVVALGIVTVSPVAAHAYVCEGTGTNAQVIIAETDPFVPWWVEDLQAKKCASDKDLRDGFGTSTENWDDRTDSLFLVGDELNRYVCVYSEVNYQGLYGQYSLDAYEHRHINLHIHNIASSIRLIQQTYPGGCP